MKITIPDELYKELEKNAQTKGFKDTNEYIATIVKNAATALNNQNQTNTGTAYSTEEEDAIKKRLSDLGYLD